MRLLVFFNVAKGKKKLLTRERPQVGKLWRDRYGDHAGWAHTILFAADLTKFRKLRNEALGEEAGESPAKRRSPSAKEAKKRKSGHREAEGREGGGGGEGGGGDLATDDRGKAAVLWHAAHRSSPPACKR
jgi:hypothetical protein